MTRAKNDLHLLVPQRFYVSHQPNRGDRHLYASRSRFLPDSILPCFESQSWPVAEHEPISGAVGPRVAFDIGARLRARWS
jgi:DNA helicase-2/ATP-dependent DNA helicase PcrA